MIRINLLPGEDRRARSGPAISFKAGDLLVPVAVLVAVALVVTGTMLSQRARVSQLNSGIRQVDDEARALAPQIERVNRLAQERAELDLRLGIINKLEKGRTQGVRLMDELARCLPDHLWLTSSQQEATGLLAIEGVTLSNLVVSDFMSRLEHSPMFSDVQLEVAERSTLSDKDLVKFRVTCHVSPDPPAKE
jgi:type IV pilus assembly protein PilN